MKVLILLMLVILFSNTVKAFEAVSARPKWKDLCPVGLENSEYKEIKWFWPYSVKETQEEINFWANKRVEFEERLNDCDVLLDSYKIKCYIDLQEKYASDFELHRFERNQKKITESIWKDFNYRGVKSFMIELNPDRK